MHGYRLGRPSATPRLVAAAFGLAIALGLSAAASAQDPGGPVGVEAWRAAPCDACHGPFADGIKDDPGGSEFPDGPNLRRSHLDRDEVLETVRCGRPGKGMPAFDPAAYTASPCYGLPLGPRPPRVSVYVALDPEQILAVVDYLFANIIGKGPATWQECVTYYGRDDLCEAYR